uniref:RING-type E3 ubiquitin transferase n=1 Tax=Strigamia maritima TaxID=126957 RepID=T1IW63_STRMM
MPIQAPQWTEFLSCPVCYNEFDENIRRPISLGCGHTVCKTCLSKLHRKQCPFDQTTINMDIDHLPVNFALLQLVGANIQPEHENNVKDIAKEDLKFYLDAKKCIEDLALYLKPFSLGNLGSTASILSRPMQRKLVTLINCQLVEEEGRARAMRAARSLGERTVTELILQHQNPQQLSANLWAAVRARGCQFLGPAMQEEVLKLVLLALEDGSALSRKVLVMFVVQRLEPHFPQASKTSIGHVVQLLYRASCFKVSKREGDSSLMQLKDEFRTYEALRREHDAQIVQIATEAGLRIAPDQWSSLLYGDTAHKSHMQSIIDKLQTPQSFAQSVQELVIALQRTGDPGNLSCLRLHLELLAAIDPSPDALPPSWEETQNAMQAVKIVVQGLVEFIQNHGNRKLHEGSQTFNSKYKTSMCRDLAQRGGCPRGANCTFAHSEEEMERYRAKNRKGSKGNSCMSASKGSEGLSPTGGMNTRSDGIELDDRICMLDGTSQSHIQYPKNHFPGVQADDMLYSTTTLTLTRSPFDGQMFRENFIPYPQRSGPQTRIPATLSAVNKQQGIGMAKVGVPYTLNPESPVYQPYNSGTNPYAAAGQPLYGNQQVFTGNPVVYPETYSTGTHTLGMIPATISGTPYSHVTHDMSDTSHSKGVGNGVEPHLKEKIVSTATTWNGKTPNIIGQPIIITSRMGKITTGTSCNVTQSLAALQQRRQEILIQLEKVQCDTTGTVTSQKYSSPTSTTTTWVDETSASLKTPTSRLPTTVSAGVVIASTGQEKQMINSKWIYREGGGSSHFNPTEDDQFIPFDPPIVSKFGPISRTAKTIIRPSNPIQVNSSLGEGTVSTPMVHGPLQVAGTMPVWYSATGTTLKPAYIKREVDGETKISSGSLPEVFAPSLRAPVNSCEQYIAVGHGIMESTPVYVQPYDTVTLMPQGTAPLWTLREGTLITDCDRMKLELQSLEQQINNLEIVSRGTKPSVILTEGDSLHQELQVVEQGIRDKELEIQMNKNNCPNQQVWGDVSTLSSDWKSEMYLEERSDEVKETYELQVAQDMQEAEKRWLYELEQDERDWKGGRKEDHLTGRFQDEGKSKPKNNICEKSVHTNSTRNRGSGCKSLSLSKRGQI